MFSFTPKLPISTEEREWVDEGFARLFDLFGRDRLAAPVVLPDLDYFPREWTPTENWALYAFDRICALMQADPARVDVEFFEIDDAHDALRESMPYWSSSGPQAPAGLYRERDGESSSARAAIALNQEQLNDPVALIATISHELAHLLLLGNRMIERTIDDMEPLTDLMTVFCGFGVFTANTAFRFHQWSSDGGKCGWSVRRLGYLSEPILGYALARYAELRNERKPAWAKHLRLNVRSYMSQSSRVLAREAGRRNRFLK